MQEKESVMVVWCELKILSLRITVWHHSASLVMSNSYSHDRIFNPHLTTIKDPYNLLLVLRVDLEESYFLHFVIFTVFLHIITKWHPCNIFRICLSILSINYHQWLSSVIRIMFERMDMSKWAASWQNQQNGMCTHRRLICPVWSVFAVGMNKAWVLCYPLSAQRRLIRLGGWLTSFSKRSCSFWKPCLNREERSTLIVTDNSILFSPIL